MAYGFNTLATAGTAALGGFAVGGPIGATIAGGLSALASGANQLKKHNDRVDMRKSTGQGNVKSNPMLQNVQPSGVESANRFSPQQMQLQNTAIQQLLAQLQNPQGIYEGFDPIAEEARNDYYSNVVPGLAHRFTTMGTQGSGAYRNAQNTAAKQFETGLAALKAQYGNQNKSLQQSQLANLLGSSPYENFYRQGNEQPPFTHQIAGTAIDNIPKILELWNAYKQSSSSPKSDLPGATPNNGFKTPTSTDMLLGRDPNQKFKLGGV